MSINEAVLNARASSAFDDLDSEFGDDSKGKFDF